MSSSEGIWGLAEADFADVEVVIIDSLTSYAANTFGDVVKNMRKAGLADLDMLSYDADKQDVPHRHRNRPQHGHRITRTRK